MYFLLYNTENARARPDVTKGHKIKAATATKAQLLFMICPYVADSLKCLRHFAQDHYDISVAEQMKPRTRQTDWGQVYMNAFSTKS